MTARAFGGRGSTGSRLRLRHGKVWRLWRLVPVCWLAAVLGTSAARAEVGASAILAEATSLIEAGRLPEARAPLEALVNREPERLEARLLLGRVYDGMRLREEAIRLLEPALKAYPDDGRVLSLYASQCLLRAGELGTSLRALRLARRGSEQMERAVLLAPENIAYREALIYFYRQAPALAGGSLAKAKKHALALAEIDPIRGGVEMSSIFIEEKRYPEALAASDAALAAGPDDYRALFTLGRTVSEAGIRLEDGDAALRRCLLATPTADQPSHAAVWFRLGRIAEQRLDFSAARAAYQTSLVLDPLYHRSADALRGLAE